MLFLNRDHALTTSYLALCLSSCDYCYLPHNYALVFIRSNNLARARAKSILLCARSCLRCHSFLSRSLEQALIENSTSILYVLSNMAENLPIVANKSCSYSLEFDVKRKRGPVPRCVLEYSSKPWPSGKSLVEKQQRAALRKKVGTCNVTINITNTLRVEVKTSY